MMDLKLPTRIINSLRDANIKTVEALLRKNPNQLLEVKGMGKKSVQEIENALKEYGLKLAPNGKIISFPTSKVSDMIREGVSNEEFIVENKKLIKYTGKFDGGTVKIPNGIERIESKAFSECNIKRVIFPEGVTSIRSRVFENCKLLKEVELPEGLTSIGYGAFRACGIESIIIPQSVQKIDECAFSACWSLKEIILPAHLMSKREMFSLPISCKVRCLADDE